MPAMLLLLMEERRAEGGERPGGRGAIISFLTYLATMYFSLSSLLLLGPGLCAGNILASQTLLAMWLPSLVMARRCAGGQSSRSRLLTLDMWDPRFLWMPEHSMQIKTPRLMLAQLGFGLSQSAHFEFPLVSDFSLDSLLWSVEFV